MQATLDKLNHLYSLLDLVWSRDSFEAINDEIKELEWMLYLEMNFTEPEEQNDTDTN